MFPLVGHLLSIARTFYGLQTSGVRWNDRLSDVHQTFKCFPCNSHVKKMLINYETMFGCKPKDYNTPT
jgi:hypothetical protein